MLGDAHVLDSLQGTAKESTVMRNPVPLSIYPG